MKTVLFVSGFDSRTRARELGYEFERYGRLVRLDIPAPKNHNAKPYAFVEFESGRDAEDALAELNGRTVNGYVLYVQWARPNSRYPPSMHSRRSQSPRSPPPRRYSRSPLRQDDYKHRRSMSPISDSL
ncbi:RNA-binding domain-containing protein [Backusella circina FSU 941]|nr:RNA-binding domain-containing protein [Backusella circina FSU 941]